MQRPTRGEAQAPGERAGRAGAAYAASRAGYPPLRASVADRMEMTRWMIERVARHLALPPVEARADRSAAWAAGRRAGPRPEARHWAGLPRLAEGHGLSGLLPLDAAADWPDGLAPAIEGAARRIEARDRRLRQDFDAIRTRFLGRDLPCAAIKGSALLEQRWPDESRRPRADLDLLVPASGMASASRALEELGYVLVDRSWKHQRFLRPDNRRVVDARGEHPDNPRPVELHPRLVESFRGIEWDLSPLAMPERPFAPLPSALLFAHLAAHTTVDALERKLRALQLIDLARLLAELEPDDVERVIALGRGGAAARFLWPALFIVDRYVTPVQPALAAALSADCPPALRSWLRGVDPDALSYFGRADRGRALLEVPRIWPIGAAERAALWRYILWPSRAALADRHPGLASSRAWPLMYPRHLGFTLLQALRRLRRRAGA